LAKSAGNVCPTEFTPKSAGKARGSSNGWACYKESRSLRDGSTPECSHNCGCEALQTNNLSDEGLPGLIMPSSPQ